jgi:hypothetical protein
VPADEILGRHAVASARVVTTDAWPHVALTSVSGRRTSDLSQGWLWFSPSIGSGSASSCVILYGTSAHTLSLMDDAGTGWLPAVAVGTGPGPQNSQCAVDTVTAGASPSGNTWTVNVPVTFAASYNGLKRIYMSAISQSGASSGWQDRGSWAPLCVFGVTPVSATLESSAGGLNISVTTAPWCAWTAPSASAFLTQSGGGGTTGSGSVSYSYGSHTGDPRSTQLTIGNTPVSVMQAGTVPTAGETVLYYHTDAPGSVRLLTDASGQIPDATQSLRPARAE